MPELLYDPETFEIVADPREYEVSHFDRGSYLVERVPVVVDKELAYVVDMNARDGMGSCTCGSYLHGIDEISMVDTCKHIRLVRVLLSMVAVAVSRRNSPCRDEALMIA